MSPPTTLSQAFARDEADGVAEAQELVVREPNGRPGRIHAGEENSFAPRDVAESGDDGLIQERFGDGQTTGAERGVERCSRERFVEHVRAQLGPNAFGVPSGDEFQDLAVVVLHRFVTHVESDPAGGQ